ncbi:DNA polymerase IV [Sedimenticola sp.]|uniref:DNA polymerase IV n=2 Tax=Sedimenticola sp. TaxID=1940285 RepID=UPI003D0DF393
MSKASNKWIMHVDMDAFFASVEQRDRPECRGRPVVVGAQPGSRGVVATCSYEARAFGIRSAMPISEAFRRCPDAVYLKPDIARYVEASQQVMALLETISPVVEPVSVDEAYLDITGLERLYGAPAAIAKRVKDRIRQDVGLGCSVGIGHNRLIAKLASEYRKPDGMTVVLPERVEGFLDPMPPSNLRGVGPQTLKTVQRLGIQTVKQLRGMSRELLNGYFGEKMAGSLYRQARGLASDQVGERGARQSISKETTFNQDVTDRDHLRSTLRALASEVGYSLRKAGLKGRVVTLKIRLAGFETHTRQRRLAVPGDSDSGLFKVAWDLLEAAVFFEKPIRLIGIGVSGWDADEPVNLDLFTSSEADTRERQLYSVLDSAAERFGKGKLSFGVPTPKKKK